MEHRDEFIGELLLSRLPQSANLSAYQEEVKSLLANNEKKLRQNKWTVVRVWIWVAVVSAPLLWMAGTHFDTPQGNWFLGIVFFWILFGAIEVAKYGHNQTRVELLKELKQLQLQVLEVHALISKNGGAPMSGKR